MPGAESVLQLKCKCKASNITATLSIISHYDADKTSHRTIRGGRRARTR